MPRRESVNIHLELVAPSGEGKRWGFTFALGRSGGSEEGTIDPFETLIQAHRRIRKELREYLESRDEKAARLADAKRVAALRRSKDQGKI